MKRLEQLLAIGVHLPRIDHRSFCSLIGFELCGVRFVLSHVASFAVGSFVDEAAFFIA